jgi:hypothetical protein
MNCPAHLKTFQRSDRRIPRWMCAWSIEEDFDAAEEKLQHALKDFRHALKDFAQALKDLGQIEDIFCRPSGALDGGVTVIGLSAKWTTPAIAWQLMAAT